MSRRQSPASKAKRKSRYPSVDAIRKRPFPTGALSSAWRLRDQEINLLSPVDWVGQQHAIAQEPEPAGLLRHENAAIRQEGDRSGVLERPGDRGYREP
jgi:hypothetical protein